LETGRNDAVSYVLRQDKITLVLTSPLSADGPINDHINRHGDGVKTVALWVDDAEKSWKETTSRGAVSVFEPETREDADGHVVLSAIETYGDTVHVFVERRNYTGLFLPGYQPWSLATEVKPLGLKYVDHMVGNVGWGEMNTWVDFYARVMGFAQLISFDDKDISTEYTALMSKVMSNGNGRIKFPINEPAEGRKKSQIEEYIDFYNGSGVQHIAVATSNIIETVTELRDRGIEFLRVPNSYYDTVLDRVGSIDEDLAPLKELGILIDRDDEGYLLQIFTKPVVDRPTMFFEIIQRKGAKSFGKGNFKALFEAIEREQETRGTL
jgi:4-hydroxyphenylpyruvate dioxygenase